MSSITLVKESRHATFATRLDPPSELLPLGDARLEFKQTCRRSQPPTTEEKKITFRFRSRLIRATATRLVVMPAEDEKNNLYFLRVRTSWIERILSTVVRLLPRTMRRSFPEWSLPSRLVLKTRKEGWDDEFETELCTYRRLDRLQGIRVPLCFGEMTFRGTRAMLLSDIGGVRIGTPAGVLLQVDDFRRMLRDTLAELAQFGILPDDAALDNFHVVGNKIFALDFEMMSEHDSRNDLDQGLDSVVNWLVKMYKGRQQCCLQDGDICPA